MLWLVLFIGGMIGLIAGFVPLILNGSSVRAIFLSLVGLLLLVAGAAGTVLRPSADALLARAGLGGASTIVAVEPAPLSDDEPAPEPKIRVVGVEPVNTSPAKDESQLDSRQPAKESPAPAETPAPRSVAVQTTTITGTESDPIAAASAAEPAADPAASTPQPSAPQPQPQEGASLAALEGQQPKDEAAFVAAMRKGRKAFDGANDAGRGAAQQARAAAVCVALPKQDVKGWVGAIGAIEKDAGNRLMVTVTLPDGTLVKTWNNAMSDIDDKTLVESGTPLAAAMEKLKTGDTVRFDGSFFQDDTDCVRSSRLGLDQSMMEPSYLFRFKGVEKL